jgi:hypothetical protein
MFDLVEYLSEDVFEENFEELLEAVDGPN